MPTLDEIEGIRKLVDLLSPLKPWRLFFADSSSDGTKDLLESMSATRPCLRLVHVEQRGLGIAMRTGLGAAIASGADLVVTMDADMSHLPSDVPRLLEAATHADVVIGSRYISGGRIIGWGPYRILMSKVANTVLRLLLRTPARDSTANFRCYNKDALTKIIPLSSEKGFTIQQELLFLANRLGLRIVEVPTTFVNRKYGASKLGTREIFRFIAYLFRALGRTRRLQSPLNGGANPSPSEASGLK